MSKAAGIWHDRDGAVVEFTAEECAVDQQIVRLWDGLEGAASRGEEVKGAAEVKALQNLLSRVPSKKAAHWRRELARIGAIDPPKAEEPKKTEEPKK